MVVACWLDVAVCIHVEGVHVLIMNDISCRLDKEFRKFFGRQQPKSNHSQIF